jgi:ketosteroid isomerase-like protein
MKQIIIFFIFLCVFGYCSYSQLASSINKEKVGNDIRLIEKSFQDYLKTHGVENAFYNYAAENAVTKRGNDSLIFGKRAIKNYYSNPMYKSAMVEWSPDFIDISDDGTMAYTYGKYKWNFTDNSGKSTVYQGIFHTVWKKTPDGWKYVWD